MSFAEKPYLMYRKIINFQNDVHSGGIANSKRKMQKYERDVDQFGEIFVILHHFDDSSAHIPHGVC